MNNNKDIIKGIESLSVYFLLFLFSPFIIQLLPIDIETCIIDPSEYDNMNNDNYDDNYDDNSIEHETPTYARYSGSWAQDEMGFSDDDIDTIFDGDPLAYWNID